MTNPNFDETLSRKSFQFLTGLPKHFKTLFFMVLGGWWGCVVLGVGLCGFPVSRRWRYMTCFWCFSGCVVLGGRLCGFPVSSRWPSMLCFRCFKCCVVLGGVLCGLIVSYRLCSMFYFWWFYGCGFHVFCFFADFTGVWFPCFLPLPSGIIVLLIWRLRG